MKADDKVLVSQYKKNLDAKKRLEAKIAEQGREIATLMQDVSGGMQDMTVYDHSVPVKVRVKIEPIPKLQIKNESLLFDYCVSADSNERDAEFLTELERACLGLDRQICINKSNLQRLKIMQPNSEIFDLVDFDNFDAKVTIDEI